MSQFVYLIMPHSLSVTLRLHDADDAIIVRCAGSAYETLSHRNNQISSRPHTGVKMRQRHIAASAASRAMKALPDKAALSGNAMLRHGRRRLRAMASW